jgi:prepilin-type processing-associated H-X9-DG protein
MLQYNQDFDERFPSGTQGTTQGVGGNVGIGWAAELYTYVKSRGIYTCPDEVTGNGTNPAGAITTPVSFGYNNNGPVTTLSQFNSPSQTVLLYEITNCTTDVTTLGIQSPHPISGDYSSPASDGNTAGWDGPSGQFATGVMSGSESTIGTGAGNESALKGRHDSGSNFLLADGHVKWLHPEDVSTGGPDFSGNGDDCNSFFPPTINGNAAQTGCTQPNFAATFNTY